MKNNQAYGCHGKTGHGKSVNLSMLPFLNGPLIAPQKPACRIRHDKAAITLVPGPEELKPEEAIEQAVPNTDVTS